MSRTYTVRVVRPVFQAITIEIDAWSQQSAVRKAMRRAQNAPDTDWDSSSAGSDDYNMHVEAVLDHQEVYETSPNPRRQIQAFRAASGAFDNTRYLLLGANMEAQAGRLLLQPWFNEADPVAQAELCADWAGPLEFIVENDGIDGERATGPQDEFSEADNIIEFPIALDDEAGSQA